MNNGLKTPTLPLFYKRTLYLLKNDKHRFFIVKMSEPTNFVSLQLKMPSEIFHQIVNLDLRTVLKNNIQLIHSIITNSGNFDKMQVKKKKSHARKSTSVLLEQNLFNLWKTLY